MSRYEFEDDEPYVVIEKQEGSVGSFLLGVAIGAGVALLMAPQSGAETRRGIGRQAGRAKQRASELAGDVQGRVSEGYNDARSRVEQRIESTRQAVELKREQVRSAVEAGRAAAQQARAELERRIAETKAAYTAAGRAARTGYDAARTGTVGATRSSSGIGGPSAATTTAAQPTEVDAVMLDFTDEAR